jgi:hypothetical protein
MYSGAGKRSPAFVDDDTFEYHRVVGSGRSIHGILLLNEIKAVI